MLYPNPIPVQDNSGGTNKIENNQVSSSSAPLVNAPPVADAGPGAVVASGQSGVVLDGSGTHLMTGGNSGVSYAWRQIAVKRN